jgi:hypothetical protein
MAYLRQFEVTAETLDALKGYPNLAAVSQLAVGASTRVIVCRLNKNFMENVAGFLWFLDRWAIDARQIISRLMATNDEAQFVTLLGELYLFAKLRECLPASVTVSVPAIAPNERGCDLQIIQNGHRFSVEVYTPIELFGYQTFCDELHLSIEKAEAPADFQADVSLEPPPVWENPQAAFWPYSIPSSAP